MKPINIFVLMLAVCFMCHVVWAQEKYISEEQIIDEYEDSSAEFEKTKPEVPIAKILSLESGTKLDEKTLEKIQFCRSYAQLANLQSTNIDLAIQKNNDEYNNIFKIWLALHDVEEEDFPLWELDGDKAVLKKVENEKE